MIHIYMHVCTLLVTPHVFATLVIVESLFSRQLCRMHDVAGVVALSGLLSVIVPSVALPRTEQATIPSQFPACILCMPYVVNSNKVISMHDTEKHKKLQF